MTGPAAGGQDPAGPAGSCPVPIDRPVMTQRWDRLTFLHWQFDAQQVQRLLPAGLRADTFGGAAWVGLVPFFMHVGTPGGQHVPWASYFCETNVRTYVRDEQDRAGIWFCSLDAARLGAVAVARSAYGLPYFWSSMRLSERDGQVSYACRRMWPGPRGTSSRIRIRVGDPFRVNDLDDLDHFLTARWVLLSAAGRRRRLARAWHRPWPLYRGLALVVEDQLIAAAGLPQPAGEPLVHYSPGVNVRIGRPERGVAGP